MQLADQDVERICKAFIKLLNAPLKEKQETQTNGKRSTE
jgi:hypothetical protein